MVPNSSLKSIPIITLRYVLNAFARILSAWFPHRGLDSQTEPNERNEKTRPTAAFFPLLWLAFVCAADYRRASPAGVQLKPTATVSSVPTRSDPLNDADARTPNWRFTCQ